MASIDDLFKKPALPSNKRKLEAPLPRDPTQLYKSQKVAPNGDVKGKGRAVEVSDDIDDEEAGPALPPDDDDADYGPDMPDEDEDEDGRFFGGGISKNESEILDFMEGQEPADLAPEKIDIPWLRKTALQFEKRINKNAELRAKYESDPTKFMGSEADLDADIKALGILAEHPDLYEEFARLGCVASLVGLLTHENTDIAIDAMEIIKELTDEDVEAEEDQWNALVDKMIEADLLNLLIDNFSRLDESLESDRAGVYHALAILENLSSRTSLAEKIGAETKVTTWLLNRARKAEKPVGQNKQYAAEILAILLQSSSTNRTKLATELDGVDLLLQLLAPYRKRDPEKGTEEEEYVENVFDCLTCVVDEPAGKTKFVEAEGVELCLIMLREGKMAKPRALRLLDHAMSGPSSSSAEVCTSLVNAAGLKTIFSMFMKKCDSSTTEHLLGIFASLLRSLPANSAERIRTLAKFVEKDYEKIAKLVSLRREFADRVESVDKGIREEQRAMGPEEREAMADEWLGRRLDAGLFCLQTCDLCLAWLVAEDGGADKRIRELLAERDEGLEVVGRTLREQVDDLENADTEEEKQTREMLSTLVKFLT